MQVLALGRGDHRQRPGQVVLGASQGRQPGLPAAWQLSAVETKTVVRASAADKSASLQRLAVASQALAVQGSTATQRRQMCWPRKQLVLRSRAAYHL